MIELPIGAVAARSAPKLLDFLLEKYKLRKELEYDIRHIHRECGMIAAAIADDGEKRSRMRNDAATAHDQWIEIVRELVYDIDDCIDRYAQLMSTAPETHRWWIRRKAHQLKTVRARDKFVAAIIRLRKQSDEAAKLRQRYTDFAYGQGSAAVEPQTTLTEAEPDTTTLSAAGRAVGMKAACDDLVGLIMETPQDTEKLKVISVVGFGGIGKTLLTRHAYQSDAIRDQYPARAWVDAATKGAPEDILEDILRQLVGTQYTASGGSSSNEKLCAAIKKRLGAERFFIVIDDMQADIWALIKDAFLPGVNSRVIVTTASRTIAIKTSSRDGHVYVMKTLTEEHSQELFFQKASMDYPPTASDKELSSEVIKKCDGLPLALVTTARSLDGETRSEQWADMGENLGSHLETNGMLASMNRVLVRSYASLSTQDIKTCLLYLGIYPGGRPIKRGSMIRRWSAEGFIRVESKKTALQVAVANFSELVDRSIIQPIDASGSSSAEVKTCQTHGIMLEFILHKSICQNFVTLLYDNVPLPRKVRWLSLNNASASTSRIEYPRDLCHLRSLTIFGKAPKSVFEFSKYKLMRVLDLEECGNLLEDKHLKAICKNMLLLRYLSLRGAAKVKLLPREIKKLHFLETLDVKGTNIEILPTQAMELPFLVHLFGKFKLHEGIGHKKICKLQTWLAENSKLVTVSGFVVHDKSQGLAQLMDHMKQLTKVKIWCESTADSSSYLSHISKAIKGFKQTDTDSVGNLTELSEAIKGFIEKGTDKNKARSLSLKINAAWCHGLLNFSLINGSCCYLSSLKLQGNKICSLPPFLTMLGGLTKLCLTFSRLELSSGMFEALNSVTSLEYLKLIATQLDKLDIGRDEFKGLRHLCVAVGDTTELKIEQGAMPDLQFLRLLCKDLSGLSGTTILSLQRLKEVALHDEVSDQTKQGWKEAANNHPRRPKLLFVTTEMVDDLFKPLRSEAAAGTAADMPSDPISTGQSVVNLETGSETAAEISPATLATTTTPPQANHDAITSAQQEYPVPIVISDNESEPPATPPSTNHDAITSAQQYPVPIVTSENESEPPAEFSPSTLATTTPPSTNHDAITSAQQEYPVPIVTSENESEPPAEISPSTLVTTAPPSTNHDAITSAQQEYPVPIVTSENEGEPPAEIRPSTLATTTPPSTNHDAITSAQQEYAEISPSTLATTTPPSTNHDAITSAQQEYPVPIAISENESEPSTEISPSTLVTTTPPSTNHDAISSAQQEYVVPIVTSENESEPPAEISPSTLATTTLLSTNHNAITSAQHEYPEISPSAIATTTPPSTNHDAITSAQQEYPVPIVVTSENESEPPAEISPPTIAATTPPSTNHDAITSAQQQYPEMSPSTLATTTPPSTKHDAITSAQQEYPVPIVTSENESEPPAEISHATLATTTPPSTNHDAITSAQQENPVPTVTSENESEPPAEISPATLATTTRQPSTNQDAITNAEQEYPVPVITSY